VGRRRAAAERGMENASGLGGGKTARRPKARMTTLMAAAVRL
jgi:hypothetical protein